MSRNSIKFSKVHLYSFISILSICFLSGILFFIFDMWVRKESTFGLTKHPLQQVFICIHGATAFLMLTIFGYIYKSHIELAFKTKKNRFMGISLVVFHIVLSLTGFLLYYIANEFFRALSIYLHLFIGLLLPVFFILHIYIGTYSRNKPMVK